MTTQEDLDISVVQQEGVSTPFSVPGRLSEHEPLVHAIDNWVLDYVLGLRLGPRRPTNRGKPMVSLRNLLSFGGALGPSLRYAAST